MKTLVFMSFLLALHSRDAKAQAFELDRFTIDGGGGTSTGIVYAVSGTIGQPDASGALIGGGFTLVGGFWDMSSVVQTPGAPLLRIELMGGGMARIFWPRPGAGYVLDATTTLANQAANSGWNPVSFPYQTNSTQISVTVPAQGHQAYRLRNASGLGQVP